MTRTNVRTLALCPRCSEYHAPQPQATLREQLESSAALEVLRKLSREIHRDPKIAKNLEIECDFLADSGNAALKAMACVIEHARRMRP